jgi:hypothetical protein
MRRFNILLIGLIAVASLAAAETASVDISSGDVESVESVLTIETALPAGAVGKRISRAVLEVAIVLGESENAAFNEFPVVELYEDGSETPKQTAMLETGLNGIARFDVTRFVRDWANTDARTFVVGAVSEDNDTVVQVGSVLSWPNGTKARLIIEYHDRDGTSVAAERD